MQEWYHSRTPYFRAIQGPPTVRGGGRPRGGRGSGWRLSVPSPCPDGLPGGKGGVSLVASGPTVARGRPSSPTSPTVADVSSSARVDIHDDVVRRRGRRRRSGARVSGRLLHAKPKIGTRRVVTHAIEQPSAVTAMAAR
eukprot:scaffold3137_cov121-Isochrysis_galbana.AAC.2